jgi:hypothetical protein
LVFGLRLLVFELYALQFVFRSTKTKVPRPKPGLSLNANDLLDLSDNFDQVFLVLHYRFN